MLMLSALNLRDMKEALGARIRRLREAAGLMQSDLAAAAHVSKARISQIENDPDGEPGCYTALGIAKALGMTVEQLLEPVLGNAANEPHAPYVAPGASSQARQLALWYDELDEDAARKFIGVLLTYGPAVSNDRVAKFLKPAPSVTRKTDDKR